MYCSVMSKHKTEVSNQCTRLSILKWNFPATPNSSQNEEHMWMFVNADVEGEWLFPSIILRNMVYDHKQISLRFYKKWFFQ